ncbi:MAG: NAD(P)/FAD-dependent oxidoreductase [Desulfobacterales bacterium]|nr:MAG: NAD(P)/FAD-dependent oxidoreductase [Desulfobacterales bacterium]
MASNKLYDVVILGTGPAGLQAAIHAARKKVSVLLMGRPGKSSLFWAHVENFYAIANASGREMLRIGREQAMKFGTEILEEDVLQLSAAEPLFNITTESNLELQTKALIIATGTARKTLGVTGEKEFLGRGVSYCVECDANFFEGADVAVVGGASAAVGGALTLLDYAKTVHLICEKLEVTDALKRQVEESATVIHAGRKVKEIVGRDSAEAIVLGDGTKIPVTGVFIELGSKGVMELATRIGIQLDDEMKYIQTTKKMETNIPGIYAAGDICGPPWQIAKAVGEGCVAGLGAAAYVKKLGKVG